MHHKAGLTSEPLLDLRDSNLYRDWYGCDILLKLLLFSSSCLFIIGLFSTDLFIEEGNDAQNTFLDCCCFTKTFRVFVHD